MSFIAKWEPHSILRSQCQQWESFSVDLYLESSRAVELSNSQFRNNSLGSQEMLRIQRTRAKANMQTRFVRCIMRLRIHQDIPKAPHTNDLVLVIIIVAEQPLCRPKRYRAVRAVLRATMVAEAVGFEWLSSYPRLDQCVLNAYKVFSAFDLFCLSIRQP
jgi:hypothetical protein